MDKLRMHKAIQIFILFMFVLCHSKSPLLAQSTASASVDQLPVSVGENREIVMPQDGSWTDVGIKYHVGYLHLTRANPGGIGKGKTVLIPGRHIAPTLVRDGVVLNVPDLMVYLWRNGQVVDWYPVSVGMMMSRWHTPIGQLRVVALTKDPVWHRPGWAGGGTVPPGPKNPLGNRWIGLNRRGYGMHGTNEPNSIGRTVSHGCIRLFPPHILDLFSQAWIGMPVVIVYQTVMVGQEGGVVYLAVFPDIYRFGSNDFNQAQRRLASFGLNNAISDDDLRQRLTRADGVARPILGSTMPVMINGNEWKPSIGPTSKGGVDYLPLRELAAAVDADLQVDNRANTITVSKNARSLSLNVKSPDIFLCYNTTFVAVHKFIEALGGSVATSHNVLVINIQ